MNNPHRCVIDKKRMYVTLVLVELIEDKENIVGYILKEGENLADVPLPSGKIQTMNQLQSDNTWKYLATIEQEEEYEKAQAEAEGRPWPPLPPSPTIEEQVENLSDLVDMMLLGEV